MCYMYDAIGSNAKTLQSVDPQMIAVYATGSNGIQWTDQDLALFPRAVKVVIDQGGMGSPRYNSTVFDAEPYAWTLPGALHATTLCTAPRPTIYCDRSWYAQVPATYTGSIWLAAPGISDSEATGLAATDKRIVAVQNLWAGTYDRSVVIDPVWPAKAVTPPLPPTGITWSAFAVQSQINVKCDPMTGTEATYEWQLEFLTIRGWELVSQQNTTGPFCTFRDIRPSGNYRFRVTRGTWSDWVNVPVPAGHVDG